MKRILTYLFCFCFGIVFSQNKQIDSLKAILKTAGQTSVRVDALNELSYSLSSISPESAFVWVTQSLDLAKKLNYQKGEAWAEIYSGIIEYYRGNTKEELPHYLKAMKVCDAMHRSNDKAEKTEAKKLSGKIFGNIGIVYYTEADYNKALEYNFKGLIMADAVGDKQQVGRILGNIGIIYGAQANYNKALEYYFKGLKLAEERKDKISACGCLIHIGNLYIELNNKSKALEYFMLGLKNAEEIKDKRYILGAVQGIGNVYSSRGDSLCSMGSSSMAIETDYPKALEYYSRSLIIAKECGIKNEFGGLYVNIGLLYNKMSEKSKAIEYYAKGLKIFEEQNDKRGICLSLLNMGGVLGKVGERNKAIMMWEKALVISKEIGIIDEEQLLHKNLSNFYEKTNRPALALEHYKKYIALRDTIFSQENSKKLMRTEMDHEYEKKKAVADAEHKAQMENQKLMADEKEKKQNIIIFSVLVGLVLVIIFAGFIFRSLRITNKQKQIIELKNKETEKQKREIEEKQKEILDSIQYARRIQTALITNEHYIKQNMLRLKK